MTDVPSLEPGAIHNNIFIQFRPYGPTGYLIPGWLNFINILLSVYNNLEFEQNIQ